MEKELEINTQLVTSIKYLLDEEFKTFDYLIEELTELKDKFDIKRELLNKDSNSVFKLDLSVVTLDKYNCYTLSESLVFMVDTISSKIKQTDLTLSIILDSIKVVFESIPNLLNFVYNITCLNKKHDSQTYNYLEGEYFNKTISHKLILCYDDLYNLFSR